jgi:hypothetical protein
MENATDTPSEGGENARKFFALNGNFAIPTSNGSILLDARVYLGVVKNCSEKKTGKKSHLRNSVLLTSQ